MLATTGTFLAGSLSGGSSKQSFSVEITLTKDLAEMAEDELGSRSYPAEVMGDFVRNSLQSLFPERLMQNTDIVYNAYEPVLESETAEGSVREWISTSDSDHPSKLLITGEDYSDAVGIAEIASDPFESNCAVLGEGYDLLKLDETDWKDRVLVSEFSFEDLSRVPNYDAFKTAIAGIHEIGHTTGLEHEDGEIYEVSDGVELSALASSYLNEHDESVNIRMSDSIYWSPYFSENAEEKLRGLL
jgi:hypothetical protein